MRWTKAPTSPRARTDSGSALSSGRWSPIESRGPASSVATSQRRTGATLDDEGPLRSNARYCRCDGRWMHWRAGCSGRGDHYPGGSRGSPAVLSCGGRLERFGASASPATASHRLPLDVVASNYDDLVHTILIPPLLCSARVYGPLLDTVWWHGAVSIADTRNDDSIAAMARRLLRDAPEQFALLGTSMGGYVALEVVRQAPERVIALALASTSARADTSLQIQARRQQSQLVEAGSFDALVDAAFPGIVSAHNESNQALQAEWRAMALAVGPDAFLRQQQAVIGRVDSRTLLPEISCPTAVIHGANDRLIPVEIARETSAAIPTSQLTVIDNAGHFLFHEQPGEAAAAVANFLAKVA